MRYDANVNKRIDISSLIQSDVRIDENTERRICIAILKQLHDSSNDVQSVAVKCLAALIQKVNLEQVLDILKKLTALMIDGKDDLRDIYSIGLKTCLTGIRTEMSIYVAPALAGDLLQGVVSREGPVKLECLDILSEMLKRFGEYAANDHSAISSACIQVLTNKDSNIAARKRAIACLGSLSAVASDGLVNKIVEILLGHVEEFEKQRRMNEQRYLVQAISAISRTTGHRLGSQIDRLVPLFLSSLKSPSDESMQNEASDELRENLLQGLESFVARCHRDVVHHIPTIITRVMEFIQYDPNYDYADDENDDDEGNGNQGGDEDMGDDYGDDEDYGYDGGDRFDEEDDDTSWKVRRSAIRVLKAMIVSNVKNFHQYFTMSIELLINRLKEREESVRLEIVECLKTLISASSNVSTEPTFAVASENNMDLAPVTSVSSSSYFSIESSVSKSTPHPKDSDSILGLLASKSPKLLKKIIKVLSEKNTSLKIRTALLNLLHELVIVLHGGMSKSQLSSVMPHICSALNDRNSALKLEGLELLHSIILENEHQVIQEHIPAFFDKLIECVNSDWYKAVSEALRVISDLTRVMRPDSKINGMDSKNDFDFEPYLNPSFDAVMARLQATDIDQDIKENAIMAMSSILARFGSFLDKASQVDPVLFLLIERLGNEVTRVPSLRAITEISKSPENVDLDAIKLKAYNDLTSLLRQQSRTIKSGSLVALEAFYVATSKSDQIADVDVGDMDVEDSSSDPVASMITEASKLIVDSDLQLSHLALSLIIAIFENKSTLSTDALSALGEETIPRLLDLSSSPLLSGLALEYLLKLLRIISSKELNEQFSPTSLFLLFTSIVTGEQAMAFGDSGSPAKKQALLTNLSKQSASSVAQCIAAVTCAKTSQGTYPHLNGIIEKLVGMLLNDPKGTNGRLVAILSLGYIGQNVDLSQINPPVHNMLVGVFDESAASEDLKVAAATSLGALTMGNTSYYIPVVMDALKDGMEQRQYLLLSTLKEIISLSATPSLSSTTDKNDSSTVLNADDVLLILSRYKEAEAEGVRNMVAECLGKLATIFPDKVIAYVLADCSPQSSPKASWTSVTAVRYMVASHNAPISYLSEQTMRTFTNLISHSDLNVRHAAMLSLNSVLHHHSSLVKSFFSSDISPMLFGETLVKAELQHKIDLGPFKLTVDDGLPLRKSAYSVFITAATTIPGSIPVDALMNPHLVNGLQDVSEVQILCFQLVSELSIHAPLVVASQLDIILSAFNEAMKDKQGNAAASASSSSGGGSNADRTTDVLRSGLRTLETMCGIAELGQNKKMHEFVAAQLKKENIIAIIKAEFSRTSSLFTFRPSNPIVRS